MTDTPTPLADYETVRRSLAFIAENWREQPSLEEISAQAGYSPHHLQRVFTRWAGLSPKAFLQAVTIDHARDVLKDSGNILDATYDLGLSSPGRLHDLFVSLEGMPPGAYRNRGEGLTVRHGFAPSPFGQALLMVTDGRLCGLAFADPGEEQKASDDMMGRWPNARFMRDDAGVAELAARIFQAELWSRDDPVRVVFIGSDFEIRVWETLLRIPPGKAATYSGIAETLGKPSAARAVGSAVGRNPVSFVVPCHRVLGKTGGLCGYHWGLTRKRAILGWEAGLAA